MCNEMVTSEIKEIIFHASFVQIIRIGQNASEIIP